MPGQSRKYPKEEFARRGDALYEKLVPTFGPSDQGKFVLIDIESGDYEIDADEIAASDRLASSGPLARRIAGLLVALAGPKAGWFMTIEFRKSAAS